MTAHVPHPYHAKLKRVLDRAGDLYTVHDILSNSSRATRCSRSSRANRWAMTRIAIYPRAKVVEVLAVVGRARRGARPARPDSDLRRRSGRAASSRPMVAQGWMPDAKRRGWKVMAEKLRLPAGHRAMSGGRQPNIRHFDLGQSDPAVDVGRWSAKLRLRAATSPNSRCSNIRDRWSRTRRRRPSNHGTSPRIRGTSAPINTMARRRATSARSGRRRLQRDAAVRSRLRNANLQAVHEPVHADGDQRDLAGDAAGERAVAEPAGATRPIPPTLSAARGRGFSKASHRRKARRTSA